MEAKTIINEESMINKQLKVKEEIKMNTNCLNEEKYQLLMNKDQNLKVQINLDLERILGF